MKTLEALRELVHVEVYDNEPNEFGEPLVLRGMSCPSEVRIEAEEHKSQYDWIENGVLLIAELQRVENGVGVFAITAHEPNRINSGMERIGPLRGASG
jgi:hypothetical protein